MPVSVDPDCHSEPALDHLLQRRENEQGFMHEEDEGSREQCLDRTEPQSRFVHQQIAHSRERQSTICEKYQSP